MARLDGTIRALLASRHKLVARKASLTTRLQAADAELGQLDQAIAALEPLARAAAAASHDGQQRQHPTTGSSGSTADAGLMHTTLRKILQKYGREPRTVEQLTSELGTLVPEYAGIAPKVVAMQLANASKRDEEIERFVTADGKFAYRWRAKVSVGGSR